MLTQQDKKQIEDRGMTVAQVERQLKEIEQGFPFLKLEAAAAVGKGITVEDDKAQEAAISKWEAYKKAGHKIVKFVPASGAASRMFKNLFAFLDASYDEPQTDFEKDFFGNIGKVLFYRVIIIRQFKNGILCVVFNFFKSLMLFVYRGKTQNKYNQKNYGGDERRIQHRLRFHSVKPEHRIKYRRCKYKR